MANDAKNPENVNPAKRDTRFKKGQKQLEGAGRPDKFTFEQVDAALKQARGIKSGAASILKCDAGTINRYITKYPKLLDHEHEARDVVTDNAEMHIFKAVMGGNLGICQWWLSKFGGKRGYQSDRGGVEIITDGKGVTAVRVIRSEIPDGTYDPDEGIMIT